MHNTIYEYGLENKAVTKFQHEIQILRSRLPQKNVTTVSLSCVYQHDVIVYSTVYSCDLIRVIILYEAIV